VLAADKDYTKALGVQRQLVLDFPEQHQYRLNLAEILIKSGDKAAARSELATLQKLGPKYPQQGRVNEMMRSLN
jgi:predicted Zn-dependent protease